jgi:hypothetical protein
MNAGASIRALIGRAGAPPSELTAGDGGLGPGAMSTHRLNRILCVAEPRGDVEVA